MDVRTVPSGPWAVVTSAWATVRSVSSLISRWRESSGLVIGLLLGSVVLARPQARGPACADWPARNRPAKPAPPPVSATNAKPVPASPLTSGGRGGGGRAGGRGRGRAGGGGGQ